MGMKHLKAPQFVNNNVATVFLAGSIEMGAAENWQDRAAKMLEGTGWTILNPRRDDWDDSWEQKITHPAFNEQVTWELQGLEICEKAIVYFDPNTKAPITLLELGLLAQMAPEKVIVVCPPGFYRKGNVDIVCDRYRIKQVSSLEEACRLLV
jgi:hypothetical protein